MPIRILIALLGFGGLAMGVAAGPGGAMAAPVAMPSEVDDCPEPDPALEERGREVYAGPGNCAACHGPDGTGTPLAPDLTDDEWLNLESESYEEIAGLVGSGVPAPVRFPAPMPPDGGGDLSAEQVCAVAAYVRSLSR